jgi:hypothetical protein
VPRERDGLNAVLVLVHHLIATVAARTTTARISTAFSALSLPVGPA